VGGTPDFAGNSKLELGRRFNDKDESEAITINRAINRGFALTELARSYYLSKRGILYSFCDDEHQRFVKPEAEEEEPESHQDYGEDDAWRGDTAARETIYLHPQYEN
jgi:ethanolamine utilization cobalamin adenosyltransferase